VALANGKDFLSNFKIETIKTVFIGINTIDRYLSSLCTSIIGISAAEIAEILFINETFHFLTKFSIAFVII
jgi:hypothetical protein